MMKSSKIFLLMPLVLLAAAAGCRDGKNARAAKPAPSSEARYAGKLQVEILPRIATAAEDLQLLYTGREAVLYRWEKNGQPISGENGDRLSRSRYARGDQITALASVNGEEGRAVLAIENAAPQVSSVAVGPDHICRGVDIAATPAAVDADGDQVSYSYQWLLNGEALSGDSPTLKGDRFQSGDRVSLKVTPHDQYEAGAVYSTQSFLIPNAAPHFVSAPPETFRGSTYVYYAKARDADGDSISYALLSGPSGTKIDSSTGRLEWQVSGQSQNYPVEIEARDSRGLTALQKYSLSITIP